MKLFLVLSLRCILKKIAALALAGFAALSLSASVALAAISSSEAEDIVRREYPGAKIYRVEQDYDNGRAVYEVDFYTEEISHGEITIDRDTGKIVEVDLDY